MVPYAFLTVLLSFPLQPARAPGSMVRLEAHASPVTWVQFSADNRIIVAGDEDGTITLWDAASGALKASLAGKGWVRCGSLAPGGKKLAVAYNDETIRLWDFPSGQAQEVIPLKGLRYLSYLPNGQLLALLTDESGIRLWDVSQGKTVASQPPLPPRDLIGPAVAVAPDGPMVAIADLSPIRIWEPATGKVRSFQGPACLIRTLAFTRDGKTLVSAGAQDYKTRDSQTGEEYTKMRGIVQLWDMARGQERIRLGDLPNESVGRDGQGSIIRAVAISPDRNLVAAIDSSCILRLWDAATGQQRARIGDLPYLAAYPPPIAFSSDGRKLAVGGAEAKLRFIDVGSGKEFASAFYPGWLAYARARMSPDGKVLVGRLYDGDAYAAFKLWDVNTGLERTTFLAGLAWQAGEPCFSADSKTLVAWDNHEDVVLYDIPTGKLRQRLPWGAPWIRATAITLDGKTVAATAGNAVHFWDVATAREITQSRIRMNLDYSRAIALTPDGKTLVTVGNSFELQVWDVATAREKARWDVGKDQVAWCVAISPDGKTVAAGCTEMNNPLAQKRSDGAIRVWDANTGKLTSTITGQMGDVYSVVFGADGKELTSQSADGTMRRWDIATGRELQRFPSRGCAPIVGYYTPDGSTVVTARPSDTKGSIQIFDVNQLIADPSKK